MGRPLRFAGIAAQVDKKRWPHIVPVRTNLLGISARAHDILIPEVEAWLRLNVRRGGWRFAQRTEMVNIPHAIWPGRYTLRVDIFFQIHMTRPNDALAFKMRWG